MTIATMDENDKRIDDRPGAQLAAVRTAKGYSIEYIASKLHLRVRVIELLEADDYSHMPDPVFVKGYLRAYAKLVDLNADSLLAIFNRHYAVEHKCEKAPLWQSQRDTSRGEKAIRWVTTGFGLVVLVSVAIWWQKSKDNQVFFAKTAATNIQQEETKDATEYAQSDIRLTDLSTMRSLLSSSPENQFSMLENKGE